MTDIESLRLELAAERHTHRKDNEYFITEIERLHKRIALLESVLALPVNTEFGKCPP